MKKTIKQRILEREVRETPRLEQKVVGKYYDEKLGHEVTRLAGPVDTGYKTIPTGYEM